MTRNEQMLVEQAKESQRVLFLPQNPHDAPTAREVFATADIELCPCANLAELVEAYDEGVGCLLLADEMLEHPDIGRLVGRLEEQPSWSDIPVLVVTRAERLSTPGQHLAAVANATLIERPVRIKSLVSTVRAALRDRRRQYDLRRSITNRDQFLAMLGHELRNPLAAIVLAVEQLRLEDIESPAIEIVRRQSANLERIVDDLLEVSRISRGVISFEKERVDLADIARKTVDAFTPIAAEQDLEMVASLPDEPVWVEGDTVRLEQVMGNLLSNAVRYTPAGGRIEAAVRRDEDKAIASVRDTGIGIAPAEIGGIFDLFAQATGESGRDEGGLGLGLSLAHSIVKQHDGKLDAHSEGKGKGSEFRVVLPTAAAAEERDARQPDEDDDRDDDPADGRRPDDHDVSLPRLLVVENADDVREPFCEMLRRRGYAVDEAASGAAAIEAVDKSRYDAILLDIGLPDIDGYEVARRIRADHDTIPMLALTGYGRREDHQRAERAGFDGLLTKPVRLDEIEAALPDSVRVARSAPPSTGDSPRLQPPV
ncbi:MAG: response regulator [Persicimonas sp.]